MALPQICDFHQVLRDFSLALKTQAAVRQADLLPLTQAENCPLGGEETPLEGPVASLKAIRDYFCTYPGSSPEACLAHLNHRTVKRAVDTGKE